MNWDWTQFKLFFGSYRLAPTRRLGALPVPISPEFRWRLLSMSLQLHKIYLSNTSAAWLQAAVAMLMRSAPFWGIVQRRVVILYRRFGTTYWSRLQGSSPRRLLDSWRWDWQLVPKRRYRTTAFRKLPGLNVGISSRTARTVSMFAVASGKKKMAASSPPPPFCLGFYQHFCALTANFFG
jgi:hypothetical protein